MGEPAPLWGTLAQARHDLVRAAVGGQPPPRVALTVLDRWPEELGRQPDGEATADLIARAWGNLQLILVDGGNEPTTDGQPAEHEAAWRRVRRSAELAFDALLDRPEWGALRDDLREAVLPRLAEAVGETRRSRLTRCRDAIRRLRLLARRTSGIPHAWKIERIAGMEYPIFQSAGWRGRAGIEVTETRIRAVVTAIIDDLRARGIGHLPLVIGYDSRVHADRLAFMAAEVASRQGQPVHLCARETPTPVLVSYLTGILGVGNCAGILAFTASTLPVKEAGAGRYAGHEYQGLRYLTPAGMLPGQKMTERLSRHAAEVLLTDEETAASTPATVTMISPQEDYLDLLLTEVRYPLVDAEGEEHPAIDVLQQYWRQPDALIVFDAMYGATRGLLAAVCDELQLPTEIHHTVRDPLFGELGAASPEPPQISELISRVKEMRSERRPIIGIALDADGDRVGVVDEHGNYLPGHALYVLLADFLLNEGYPGEPGLLVRTREVTRAVDRLAERPEYADRIIHPPDHQTMPDYLRDPEYRRLTGDPARLHGRGVYVARDAADVIHLLFSGLERQTERWEGGELSPLQFQGLLHEHLDRLLLAGDARGALMALGHSPYPDGIWIVLLVLQLCAIRRTPIGRLWREMQERVGETHIDRLRLHAPDDMKRMLVNRFLRQFEQSGEELAGCRVEFAGGMRDRFIEWALTDPNGAPAYCTVQAVDDLPLVRVIAEAASTETTHRLLMLVAREVESLIANELRHAGDPWTVVDIFAELQIPPAALADLPGTLNCRIAQQAYARLQELARPGLEAPELLRFVTDRLSELEPEKAAALSACQLGQQRPAQPEPKQPRIRWEDVGEI